MSRTVLAAVAVLALAGSTAHGGVIVGYRSINATTRAAALTATGVEGVDLARGDGIAAARGSTFNSNQWLQPGGLGGSKSTAVLTDHFLTWGFTSDVTTFDLTTLDIAYDRSTSGPTSIAIDIAVNGSGLFSEVHSNNNVSASENDLFAIDLSTFTNVTSAMFRLSGWNAGSNTGTFDPENRVGVVGETIDFAIVVNGEPASVSAVPEPGSLILMLTTAIGGLFGGVRSRLRQLAA